MKALFTALAALVPLAASAAQVVFTASPDVTTYSIVVVDGRKLKVPLAQALASYPGEECTAASDSDAVPSCFGFTIANGLTYGLGNGFPKWPDPKDPRKELRIDGLKTVDLVNFHSVGQCTASGCPPVPPPGPMTITFTQPTVEFGFMFRASWPNVDVPFTSGFRLIADGVDLGFYPVEVLGVQYIGVSAPEGLRTLTVVPGDGANPDIVGPAVIHRFYRK
jgi:hypothetical protein